MKSIVLSLILLSLPVMAQEPPKKELCIDANTMSVIFLRQGENIVLLTRVLSCAGEELNWITDVNRMEIVDIPVQEIKI